MFLGISVFLGLINASFAIKMCISSNKFTAMTMQLVASMQFGSSTPDLFDAMNIIDYDIDQQMLSLRTTRYDARTGTVTNSTTTQDFRTSKTYITESGQCHEEPYTGPFFRNCLPESMVKTGSYTIAGGRVTVNIYSGNIMGNRYYIHITETGEPFLVTTYSLPSLGMHRMETQLFGNVRMGVVGDPTAFQHMGCQGNEPAVGR